MSTLDISVTAGDAGPVIVLSGEADITTVGSLSDALSTQLAAGARRLTVDLAGLRYADSASIRVLVLTARALGGQKGNLVLLRPSPALTETLTLVGANEFIAIIPDM